VDALTIEEFGRKLRASEISAAEVTEHCLEGIRAHNQRLNAFILVMTDEARRQARDADRELAAGRDRGPLHGVPISIKDLIDIKGTPTTAASRVREGHVAAGDAPVIAALREAGAVLIGKTNLHEFAFGTTNEESAFGPARNPFDVSRSPGGSSGGSGISVATGMALASIGTDTGGSIRIPAALCGVVGLKATYGEVSTEGVVPLSRNLDHVGPLTRSVNDAWLVHRALVGMPKTSPLTPRPIRDLRLTVLRPYFCDLLDAEVRASFDTAIKDLRAAGARVTEAGIAHADAITSVYLFIQAVDASTYHARTLETVPEKYTVPVRLRLEMGRYILGEDYLRALKGREVLGREVDAAVAACDALVLPTIPIPAPALGAETVTIDGAPQPLRAMTLRLTQPFNVSRHPAVTIPIGLTAEGLPCGLQIVGARGQTEALLRVALACESSLDRGSFIPRLQ
jgi:aspartyl-tRNA(Asn)/glutamyl-tRNA(Gln) amidotransferase subunit A